jgi:hypothetical protein
MTNGGTVDEPNIRPWPSLFLTVDQDITFVWHEFLGSEYRISTYGTGGPWDRDANPRNPHLSLTDLAAMREDARCRSRSTWPTGS